MGLIRALIKLPPLFWVMVIMGYLYYTFMTWESETLIPLQSEVTSKRTQLARLQKWDPLESTCRHASLSIL